MADDESVVFETFPAVDGDGVRWEIYWMISGGVTLEMGRAENRKQAKSDAIARATELDFPLFVQDYLRGKRKIPRPAPSRMPAFSALFPLYRNRAKSGA